MIEAESCAIFVGQGFSLTVDLVGYSEGIKGVGTVLCKALLLWHTLDKALAPSQAQPYH